MPSLVLRAGDGGSKVPDLGHIVWSKSPVRSLRRAFFWWEPRNSVWVRSRDVKTLPKQGGFRLSNHMWTWVVPSGCLPVIWLKQDLWICVPGQTGSLRHLLSSLLKENPFLLYANSLLYGLFFKKAFLMSEHESARMNCHFSSSKGSATRSW